MMIIKTTLAATALLTLAGPVIAQPLDGPGDAGRSRAYPRHEGRSSYYPSHVRGGVDGDLPFNNQIRKHTDPLNANGAK